MEENFSIDGGGDLLLIEELDDLSYNHNDYVLNHVFVEDKEKRIVEKIDKELSAEQIKKHIAMVLYNLPERMRRVFELTAENIELEEIAELEDKDIEEVQQLFSEAKEALRTSFFNRYALG